VFDRRIAIGTWLHETATIAEQVFEEDRPKPVGWRGCGAIGSGRLSGAQGLGPSRVTGVGKAGLLRQGLARVRRIPSH